MTVSFSLCLSSTWEIYTCLQNMQQSLLIKRTFHQFRGHNVTFVHLVGDDHVLQRFYTFFCLSLQFLQGFKTFKPLYHLCNPCHSCKKQFVAQNCLIYMYNMCMWQLKLYHLIGPTDIQNLEYTQ